MTSEYKSDAPCRRPAKGDLAQRILNYSAWCREEGPNGEWQGDVLMDVGQVGLVLTDSYQALSGFWFVKMLVDGNILVVDADSIAVV